MSCLRVAVATAAAAVLLATTVATAATAVAVAAAAGRATPPPLPPVDLSVGMHTFEQPVDHMHADTSPTFAQRYNVTSASKDDASRLTVLFLAGEAPMDVYYDGEASSRAWADALGARYVLLEHRQYGKSLLRGADAAEPFDTATLRYLSSLEALRDAVRFVRAARAADGARVGRWLLMGCSYSGALAGWFRHTTHNDDELVAAAYGPSGPYRAQLLMPEYAANFATAAPPGCLSAVRHAMVRIDELLASAEGRSMLAQRFGACHATIAPAMVPYFQNTLALTLASLAQGNDPPSFPLTTTCERFAKAATPDDAVSVWASMFTDGGRALRRVAAAARVHELRVAARAGDRDDCVSFNFTDVVTSLSNTSNADRAWQWQKCTEFGWFKLSAAPFWDDDGTFVRKQLLASCATVFGIDELVPDIELTNTLYGGTTTRFNATNLFITNGRQDPWRLVSFTEAREPNFDVALYDAGHCAPPHAPTEHDPPSVVEARARVLAFLRAHAK